MERIVVGTFDILINDNDKKTNLSLQFERSSFIGLVSVNAAGFSVGNKQVNPSWYVSAVCACKKVTASVRINPLIEISNISLSLMDDDEKKKYGGLEGKIPNFPHSSFISTKHNGQN